MKTPWLGQYSASAHTEDDTADRLHTLETGSDEELLLFSGQRPGSGCSSHLIFRRLISRSLYAALGLNFSHLAEADGMCIRSNPRGSEPPSGTRTVQ